MASILVIDDDQDILRMLEFALKRAGHAAITVSDGEQGLTEAEVQEPDLIVCDVMMPKMTGYEFCRRARSIPALEDTPIIVFSARFQPVDKQTALDAGATDFMAKTSAPDVLVQHIEQLLPDQETTNPAKTVGLFSLRGGTGVTALTVNVSIAAALAQKTAVALADLAVSGGHAAVFLGLKPTSNFYQLLRDSRHSLSPETIKRHMVKHDSGVQLLASPPTFEQTPPAKDDLLSLTQHLKSVCKISLIDAPHIFAQNFSPLLKKLDKIILVLAPDVPSIQSTVVALQGMSSFGVTDKKIKLVINQVVPQNGLSTQTIQKILKRPIFTIIPYDAHMIKAVNSGKPFILAYPQSPTALAITKLAESIFPQ